MTDDEIKEGAEFDENDPEQKRLMLERSFYSAIVGEPFDRQDLDISRPLSGDQIASFKDHLKDASNLDWHFLQGVRKMKEDGLFDEERKQQFLDNVASKFAEFVMMGEDNK